MKAIRDTGRWARRMPQSGLTGGGLPDVLVALRAPRGRGLWLEFKREGEKPTRLQLATHEQLRRAGFAVDTVHSSEEALEAVERAERDWSIQSEVGRWRANTR